MFLHNATGHSSEARAVHWSDAQSDVALHRQFRKMLWVAKIGRPSIGAPKLASIRTTSGGRRLTARQKLITAAYVVMSRNGLEDSTLSEVIDQAGVGVGSFYNHFTSKEELAQAAFSSRVEEFVGPLVQAVRHVPNAALATGFVYRRFIEEAEGDKVWAAFVIKLEPSMQMFDRLMREHARAGMRIGVESGHFKIDNIESAITAIHAMEVAMVTAMLNGLLSHKEAHQSVLFALRMFGVEETEARRIAGSSMADLRREMKSSRTDRPIERPPAADWKSNGGNEPVRPKPLRGQAAAKKDKKATKKTDSTNSTSLAPDKT